MLQPTLFAYIPEPICIPAPETQIRSSRARLGYKFIPVDVEVSKLDDRSQNVEEKDGVCVDVEVGLVVAAVECVMVLSVVVDIKLEVVSAGSEVEEDGV